MKGRNSNYKGKQGRKDSSKKRVNFDNTRIKKFEKDIEKDRDMDKDDPRNMKQTSKSNDVSWYAANPELLKAAASIPFVDVTGAPFPKGGASVPGIQVLMYAPCLGSKSSPINQAANQIYSDTVHANSRNKSYDAPDEMLLILAGAQVFSAISMGLRAYGTMRRYNQQDRYTPSQLVKAMGFNFEDLKSNLANMWFDLNQLIVQSRQIWIPNVMPLIQRWFWMNANIYRDGNSIKSQYYMFVPWNFLKYNETTLQTGGGLEPITWIDRTQYSTNMGQNTWKQYVSMVNSLIDALINSQDRGIIFGDILKAYGADKLYAMPEIGSDYTIEAVYDREVLSQIENAFVWNVNSAAIPGWVAQQDNLLYHELAGIKKTDAATMDLVAAIGADYTVLNFHQLETPTPEQVMVATRLTAKGIQYLGNPTWNGTSYYTFLPAVAGTEVIITTYFVRFGYPEGKPQDVVTWIKGSLAGSDTLTVEQMFNWAAFDWNPGIEVYTQPTINWPTTGGTSYFGSFINKILDYDNFTVIATDILQKMHTTAVYSEFGVTNRIS